MAKGRPRLLSATKSLRTSPMTTSRTISQNPLSSSLTEIPKSSRKRPSGSSGWPLKTASKSTSPSPMIMRSSGARFPHSVFNSSITSWKMSIIRWSSTSMTKNGVFVTKSQRRSSRGIPRSFSQKSRKPWSLWAPGRNFSSSTPKNNNDFQITPTKTKKYSTTRRNSNNGYKQSTTSWTTTPIKEESLPTPALMSNSTTGERGCRRSPTGLNSLKARTSNKLSRASRSRNHMRDKKAEATKTSPNSWWTSTALIFSSRTNWTKRRIMSSTFQHWRSSSSLYTKAPPSRSAKHYLRLWMPLRWSIPLPDSTIQMTRWPVFSSRSPIKWSKIARSDFWMDRRSRTSGRETLLNWLKYWAHALDWTGNTKSPIKRRKRKWLICQRARSSISQRTNCSENLTLSWEDFRSWLISSRTSSSFRH